MAYAGDDRLVALAVHLRKAAYAHGSEKIANDTFQPALEKLSAKTTSPVALTSANLSMALHFTKP